MCATQASSYKTRCLSPYMRILVPDLIERTISKLLKRYLDFSKLLDCRAPLGVKLTRCHPNTVVYLVPNIYLSLSLNFFLISFSLYFKQFVPHLSLIFAVYPQHQAAFESVAPPNTSAFVLLVLPHNYRSLLLWLSIF